MRWADKFIAALWFYYVTCMWKFGEDHVDGMEVRYFEVDAGGHTTLEKHEHTHLVIPIKGKGACLVGDEVLPLDLR